MTRAPRLLDTLPPAPHLTPRQQEVFLLLLDGHGPTEIARLLFMGEGTVKEHMRAIRNAFGMTGGHWEWLRVAREWGRAEGREER